MHHGTSLQQPATGIGFVHVSDNRNSSFGRARKARKFRRRNRYIRLPAIGPGSSQLGRFKEIRIMKRPNESSPGHNDYARSLILRWISNFLLVGFGLTLLSSVALAQQINSSIAGTVTDEKKSM